MNSKKTRIYKNRYFKLFAISIAVLSSLFLASATVNAATLIENDKGVPDIFRNLMTDTWRYGPCVANGTTFNHAQYTWLSPSNDQRATRITIDETQSSFDAKFNMISAHCDSGVNNNNRPTGTGIIINKDLKATQTRVISASVTVNGNPVTVTGIGGKRILLDYAESYQFNSRYIKRPTFSGTPVTDRDFPHYLQFNASGTGIGNLAPGDYTINISVTARIIHKFISGANTIYKCVDAPNLNLVNGNGQQNGNLEDARCPTRTVPQTIQLTVLPRTNSRCEIRDSTPNKVQANSLFIGAFTAINGGAVLDNSSWRLKDASGDTPSSRFKLEGLNTNFVRTTGPFNERFRVEIGTEPSSEITNSMGGRFLTPGARGISAQEFRAPATPGFYEFEWSIIKEDAFRMNGTSQGGHVYQDVKCSKRIEVVSPTNTPFIRATGADVLSGAKFGTTLVPCTGLTGYDTRYPSNKSRDAEVNTSGNGEYGDEEDTEFYNGASSAQYAVLSSGKIGDNSTSNNNFWGNDAFYRDEANDGKKRDLLFANVNVTNNQEYGYAYRGQNAGVPCIDISPVEKLMVDTSQNTFAGILTEATVVQRVPRSLTINATQLSSGKRKILVVDGKVTITGNLTYPTSYSSVSNIPFLKIIAKGGIEIQRGVTTIDAHLYSVPTVAANSGTIDTCSNDTTYNSPLTWPTGGASSYLQKDSCEAKLTVNGSLVAKRILWKRTFGTLNTTDTTVAGTSCVVATGITGANEESKRASLIGRLNTCSAEAIRFNPEAFLADPMSNSNFSVGSIPVSTSELPPIY